MNTCKSSTEETDPQRPVPEKELVVKRANRMIDLTPHSNDAKLFIETEGPTFGQLILPLLGEITYNLIPHPGYSTEQVMAFFDKYNTPRSPSIQPPDPAPLIAELRQTLLDNAPLVWRTDGELDALSEQMQTDEAVLRVAIHFISGTGKFIRQE